MTYAPLVSDWARLAVSAMMIVGGAILTSLLIDLFPVIGLTLASVALIVALVLRSSRVAAAIALGSVAFLALVLLQLGRCDPNVQDCAYSIGTTVVVGWMVILAATSAIAVVLISRRKAAAQ